MQLLRKRLRNFKLSGIYQNLEERVSYAQEKSLSYGEFLGLLLEDEENNRRTNSYKKRYARARLSAHKNIEDFDFSFQPSIDKRTINDCLTCNFITKKRNIVFIGNPGTGKTHLSIAIGIKALMKGYKVLFTPVSEMLHNLNAGKADNTYYQKVDYYLKPDLLILDELGFKRYEKGSVIITTNKTFSKWGDIFTDNILASAILDRAVHYSNIVKINGPSFRAKHLKERGK